MKSSIAFQAPVTADRHRTVVASIAPQIELAEIARSRRDTMSLHAWQLARRATGLYHEAYSDGNAGLMQQGNHRLRGGD